MSCMCECLSPPTASGVVPPLSTEALWCCVFTGSFSCENVELVWNIVQWLLVLHTEGSQLGCFGDPTRKPAALQVNGFTQDRTRTHWRG